MRPPLSVLVLFTALAFGGPVSAADVQWLTDPNAAWETTQRKQRPLLIYLTMQGCHYCTLMQQQTYGDAQIAKEINRSFVAMKLENTEAHDLIRALGVTIFPTTVVVSPERKLLMRVNGYLPPDKLKQRIGELKDKSPKRP